MGDYMFMLESHLSAGQYRVVGQMRELASEAGLPVFLTGGAMRDTLGGFPVRDLDFTVEGNALKLAKLAETEAAYGRHDAAKQQQRDHGGAGRGGR